MRGVPRLRFETGNALDNLPKDPFDILVLSNVLEHLPARTEFLRKVTQNNRPDRVLIRVPNYERDWRTPLKRELGVEWRLDPTHETEHTEESLAAELMDAGLEIAEKHLRFGEIWVVAIPLRAK